MAELLKNENCDFWHRDSVKQVARALYFIAIFPIKQGQDV